MHFGEHYLDLREHAGVSGGVEDMASDRGRHGEDDRLFVPD